MKMCKLHKIIFFILSIYFSFNLISQTKASSNNKNDTTSLRKNMVKNQIQNRGILDKRILNAFLNVKKEAFVNLKNNIDIYADKSVPIGEGQTISRAYITAIILSAIVDRRYKKILDIGTGSGYQSAILSELNKEVFTIEIKENLSKIAEKKLSALGYTNIKFKAGDGYQGWKQYAPFDGIIITSSLNHIPPKLVEQLAIGGRMIIPVAYSKNVQELVLIEKINNNKIKKINLIPVDFVPIIRLDKNKGSQIKKEINNATMDK